MTTLRVLLADDDALVRAGLRTILSAAGDLHVVGEAMLSPSATRTLIERFSADTGTPRRAAAEQALQALTGREREVAAEVAKGRSNADIAARLYMSEATVKAHVSRALAKLGAANRVQVAIIVRDAGLA